MADRLTPDRRSWLMSRIGAKNTKPEIALRRALFSLGVRGWRLHAKSLPGKPDLVFSRARVAVFVDGAFWHGHPTKFSPGRLPPFWEQKILTNQSRDKRVDAELRRLGWRVIRIWDLDVRKNVLGPAQRIRRIVEDRLERGDGYSESYSARSR